MRDNFIEFKPQIEQWNDLKLSSGRVARGYRYRNLAMARAADYLYDIEPEWEPWMEELKKEPYQGFRSDQWGKFFRRSGGHWTLQQAKKRKIHTDVIVI